MDSESNGKASSSGVLRSELSTDPHYIQPTVMTELEQLGYIRPRYTVAVTGEPASGDGTAMILEHETHEWQIHPSLTYSLTFQTTEV